MTFDCYIQVILCHNMSKKSLYKCQPALLWMFLLNDCIRNINLALHTFRTHSHGGLYLYLPLNTMDSQESVRGRGFGAVVWSGNSSSASPSIGQQRCHRAANSLFKVQTHSCSMPLTFFSEAAGQIYSCEMVRRNHGSSVSDLTKCTLKTSRVNCDSCSM